LLVIETRGEILSDYHNIFSSQYRGLTVLKWRPDENQRQEVQSSNLSEKTAEKSISQSSCYIKAIVTLGISADMITIKRHRIRI
jgi:hypothetical protein